MKVLRNAAISLTILAGLLLLILADAGTAAAGSIDPALDPDNDGCTTGEELGTDPTLGGMRDPNNPYDFFDVPPRDNMIRISDILGVVQHFFVDSNDPHYSFEFDRSGPPPGGDPWDLGPPDGQVRVSDILMVVGQFFHQCSEIEWCNGDVKDGALLDIEPLELAPGETWRDCFEVRDDMGKLMGYLIRNGEAEATVEELTNEEAAGLGYTTPEPWEGEAASLAPWRAYSCTGRVWSSNRAGGTVNEIHLRQDWVTTPYTNIRWPPPDGSAWADSHYGWHVQTGPNPNPAPYAIRWYSIPNNIVSVGETHATSYHELTVGGTIFGFGITATIASQRLHVYLRFNYGTTGSQYCHVSHNPH
mgnify:CR=1 FL=1